MRFKDKVALITAVGSGIGRATADIMAKEGAVIIGVDNDERRLAMAIEAMNMAGGRAIGRPTDALDERHVNEVVDWAAKQYGAVDILVNAVGGSTIIEKPGATVDELTFEEWQKLIHFNLTGTFLFCHAVTPLMKRRRHGKIVNLASIAGRGLSASSSSVGSNAAHVEPTFWSQRRRPGNVLWCFPASRRGSFSGQLYSRPARGKGGSCSRAALRVIIAAKAEDLS